jgi:hypothetical protein
MAAGDGSVIWQESEITAANNRETCLNCGFTMIFVIAMMGCLFA